MKLGIIGGGRAAWAFGSTLRERGWEIAGVSLRDTSTSSLPHLLEAPRLTLPEVPQAADILVFALTDRAIAEVYGSVGQRLDPDLPVFHASGALTSDVFGDRRQRFSLHPLRALPPAGGEADLRDTLLVFEGPQASRDMARAMAETMRGRFAEVRADQKVLYHAGAVFASNYVAMMLETCRQIIASAGVNSISNEDVEALAISAVQNWRRETGARRFTGPIARGDETLLNKHLQALSSTPEFRELYRRLALALASRLHDEEPMRQDLAAILRLLVEDSQ